MTEPRNQCHDMSSQLARRGPPMAFKQDPNQEKYLKLKDEFDDSSYRWRTDAHIQGSEEWIGRQPATVGDFSRELHRVRSGYMGEDWSAKREPNFSSRSYDHFHTESLREGHEDREARGTGGEREEKFLRTFKVTQAERSKYWMNVGLWFRERRTTLYSTEPSGRHAYRSFMYNKRRSRNFRNLIWR